MLSPSRIKRSDSPKANVSAKSNVGPSKMMKELSSSNKRNGFRSMSLSREGSSGDMRPSRHTLEKILDSHNPWHFEFLMSSLAYFLITTIESFTTVLMSELVDDESSYTFICDGNIHYSLNAGNITANRTFLLINEGEDEVEFVYPLKTVKMAIFIISPIMAIWATTQLQVMRRISIKIGIISGCLVSAFSMFLLAINTHVWTVLGLFLNKFGSDIVIPLTITLVVESTPKRIRDFSILMGSVGQGMGHVLHVTSLLYFRSQHWTALFLGGLWVTVAVVIGFTVKDSIMHLICTFQTEEAKKRLNELADTSDVGRLDFDRVIDDVLYIGKAEEPEDGIDALWMGMKIWEYVNHIGFYTFLKILSQLELFASVYPLLMYTPLKSEASSYIHLTLYGSASTVLLIIFAFKLSRKHQLELSLFLILLSHLLFASVTVLPSIEGCAENSYFTHPEGADALIPFIIVCSITGIAMLLFISTVTAMEHTCHTGRLVYHYTSSVISTGIIYVIFAFYNGVLFTSTTDPSIAGLSKRGQTVDGKNVYNFLCRFILCFGALIWSFFIKDYDSSIVTHNDILIRFGYDVVDMEDDSDSEDEFEKNKQLIIDDN